VVISEPSEPTFVDPLFSELDARLYRTVSEWLAAEWPFRRFDYAPR